LCNSAISGEIDLAKRSVDCAFYSLKSTQVIKSLDRANRLLSVRLIVQRSGFNRSYLRIAKPRRLMHNKFCVIDKRVVVTGSYNPSDLEKGDADGIVVIHSRDIAAKFAQEFEELWGGVYGRGQPSPQIETALAEQCIVAYFCPEDDCAQALLNEVEKAKHEIRFVYYSFTLGELALALVRLHSLGVAVNGIFEDSQVSGYSQYWLLRHQGVDVCRAKHPAQVHHKFMVIDNTTLVIGSFNPTKSAQLYNDENMVVIKDAEVARLFAKEFSKLNKVYCQKIYKQ